MIRLIFQINREVFKVEIKNMEIWYSDRLWDKLIRLIPKDKEFIKKIVMSRNKIPNTLLTLFDLTEQEQKEYNSANSDEQLAEICIRDARNKGALLLKRENG